MGAKRSSSAASDATAATGVTNEQRETAKVENTVLASDPHCGDDGRIRNSRRAESLQFSPSFSLERRNRRGLIHRNVADSRSVHAVAILEARRLDRNVFASGRLHLLHGHSNRFICSLLVHRATVWRSDRLTHQLGVADTAGRLASALRELRI